MITLTGISKEYDLRPVLDDVNLALSPGLRYVLAAPNGSGKTTLLQIMAGLVRPSRGKVTWQSHPFTPRHRRNLGVMLQDPMLYGDLNAVENLRLFSRLYGLKNAKDCVQDMLHAVSLEKDLDLHVRQYSKGMRQRLALARALIHQPQLLLLDEPLDGMDKSSREQARQLIEEHVREGATLFLVTHEPESHPDADMILTIRHGRVVKVS